MHLVLVNNPALVISVPAVVAAALFDDFIDGQMVQSRFCCQELAVARLADTGSTGDDDVWLISRHVCRYGMSSAASALVRVSFPGRGDLSPT